MPGGTGDDVDAANLTGTLSGSGGDVPLTCAFQLTGAPAGFSYVSDGAGGVLVQQGGITVLTITLDPATGAYTVTQNAPIDHAAGGDENDQGFTLAYTVTDVDGDSAAGTLAIDVDDDTPVASASTTQPVLTVDETNRATNASASFAGVFTTAFGADGAGGCRLRARHHCRRDRPHRHRHRRGGQPGPERRRGRGPHGDRNLLVFTVSVDAAGTVTLDQQRAVVHPDAANPDDPVSLAADSLVTLTATVTDGDGDRPRPPPISAEPQFRGRRAERHRLDDPARADGRRDATSPPTPRRASPACSPPRSGPTAPAPSPTRSA